MRGISKPFVVLDTSKIEEAAALAPVELMAIVCEMAVPAISTKHRLTKAITDVPDVFFFMDIKFLFLKG